MSRAIEIKNKKKGERQVKALLKKQTRAKVDTESGIPGLGERLEEMEKKIAALKKDNSALTMTVGKLWKWKVESEMKK